MGIIIDIKFLKAEFNDLDEVENLYNDLCDFLTTKDYNPGFRKGYYPTKQEALYFFESDTLYVAKVDGKIVGSIALTHNPNAETNANLKYDETNYSDMLFIHIFVVHPEYQRQGIGTEILSFAEQCAREEGVKVIRLYVCENNYVAIRSYEKSGFVYISKEDIGLSQYGLKWFCLYEKSIDE